MKTLTLLPTLLLASTASAQYLIDTTGGTVLSTVGDNERVYADRPLGFSTALFGTPCSNVDISVNGIINFIDAAANSTRPLPHGFYESIMPFWADLEIAQGDRIIEKVEPGVYYSVTWEASVSFIPGAKARCQFVWFNAKTSIRGVTFLPGDIAFSYGEMVLNPSIIWSGISGLNAGDGDTFAVLPRDPRGNGYFQSNEIPAVFPSFADTGAFTLFRRAGALHVPMELTVAPTPANPCPIDFNGDGFVDFFDYDDFVHAYEHGC